MHTQYPQSHSRSGNPPRSTPSRLRNKKTQCCTPSCSTSTAESWCPTTSFQCCKNTLTFMSDQSADIIRSCVPLRLHSDKSRLEIPVSAVCVAPSCRHYGQRSSIFSSVVSRETRRTDENSYLCSRFVSVYGVRDGQWRSLEKVKTLSIDILVVTWEKVRSFEFSLRAPTPRTTWNHTEKLTNQAPFRPDSHHR